MDRALPVKLKAPERLRLGGFILDLQDGELRRADGTPAELRRQALRVLLVLAERVGHVVGKDELMRRVWPDVVVTEDSLVQTIHEIRRVLGDERHRFVRTAARRGYMLVLDEPGTTPEPSDKAALGNRLTDRSRIGALAVLLALIGLMVAAWWSFQRTPATPEQLPRIAVLAFRDRSGTADGATLGRGLAEDTVLALGRHPGWNVISHHSSFAISDKGLSIVEMGRQLRAQYLIDGVLSRSGERVSLEVGLIDARTDKLLWVSRHETEGGRIVEARDAVVEKVAATLLSKLRESERLRAASQLPKTLDVYALTVRAVALIPRFTAASYREGRTLLETVLAADPGYAPAWWVLSWLNAVDGLFGITGEWNGERAGEAIAQANRSIELDGSNPLAWSALSVALQLADRHEESLTAAHKATELGPGDAEAWLFYARALLVVRPPAQALAAVERALAMNPIPPVYFQGIHASVLWGNDLAEEALREADACLRRAPLFATCRHVRLQLLAETGRSEEARAEAVSLGQQGIRYESACLRWAGSAANAERCQRHSRAAGLSP